VIRLQKALADRGVASRRKAEELIVGGRVQVDGELVTALGSKVRPDARIEVDGAPTRAARPRYVLLNKPMGIVSTANDERGRKTVVDLIGAPERLYPVGRLDTDSEGMLLLTNDGDWAERVLHPRFGHEREYDVSVSGELTPEVVMALHDGVRLEEGLAVATRIEVVRRSRSASRLRMVLHTGWRRQIRRMLSVVGLKVTRLVRVRIGDLALGKLRTGEWRELTAKEIADLARPVERPRTVPRARPVAAPKDETGAPTSARATPPAAPRRPVSAAQRRARPAPQSRAPRTARRPPGPNAPRSFGARPTSSRPASPRTAPRGPRRAPLVRAGSLARRQPARRYGETRGPVRAKVAPR
jgi:23S rRNA pseudouridine2605 synthase